MSAVDFRIGDLVWAKMKGFPSWPAKISEPKKTPKKFHHYVFFFGTKDYAWIQDEFITPHSDAMLANLASRKMTSTLKAAVDEITEAAKDAPERPPREEREPSIKVKLAMKYRKLKDSKKQFQVPKKRFFGNRPAKIRKPKAVITPYDDDPQLDVAVSTTVVCHVPPTDKKIGFIGLGAVGQSIVRNLLKSGHNVTIWNRTAERCDEFVKSGACKAATPADVIAACDITFCCVEDPEASKVVVFSQAGVLKGLEEARRGGARGKGYVEMTSMDDLTSQEIGDAVSFEGGRYLEAQLGSSSRQQAYDGALTVLGAGDIDLFRECETCFHAISKHAYFIGRNVGQGSRVSLVANALAGTACAAIGEALALADRIGVSKKDLLEVAWLVGYGCPMVDGRLLLDHHRRQPPTVPVKNQQKDLHLAMRLSNDMNTPMSVTASANELYKHAKRLGYRHRDTSAVYLATKF